MPFSSWAILFPPHGVVLSVQIMSSLGSELGPAPPSPSHNRAPFTAAPLAIQQDNLTIAVGHWEFSPPVPLELDKAHGPFETHQSQCCSGAVLQDMVSWNVRGRRQEQSQTLFPQNNLWDGFSRASTAIS